MSGFEVIPAVDIRGGRCVRLVQGDFGRETTYGDDPVAMAQHWQAAGASRLHVVDLDGARDGQRANADVIQRLLAALVIPVQVGGGVRTVETARTLLDQGADRVIVGTAALERSAELADWLATLGAERLIIGVDARDGRVATHGWQAISQVDVVSFCDDLRSLGVQRVLYTDVARDGMLGGPNIETTRTLARGFNLKVLASGGVSTPRHLAELAEAGAEGAIVGTALYDGRLRLHDALSAVC